MRKYDLSLETPKMTAICYKTTKPMVINRGTKWEVVHDTFVAYYTYKTLEEAQLEAERLNAEKPEKLFNGEPALCDERTYYAEICGAPY